ncbi:TetR/AcrR family transcriptional regulator [Palleronia abyssalis]|uniref:Transcriptional repressor Mce3R n=1 Tax=Palleronia abyssalis TaxID=1501240 RepID=A0A2R8BXS1_9RHOB|nr:TetR/AcrR family transcriptional regulator [Palleronia abyssalis]SPJ24922.1 Transcriptional repressor Mce3R [Palleronia abyssalis]
MAPSDRREAILDAAQSLFVSRGWDAVTMADVVAAAGISKGGFYHHFATKDDLLAAIVARMTARTVDAAKVAREQTEGDALVRLNAFIAETRRWNAENPEALPIFAELLSRPEDDALSQRTYAATAEILRPALTEMITEGVESGLFDAPAPALIAEIIVGLTKGRRAALAQVVAEARADRIDAATQVLEARLTAEGAVCDRLLGLPEGSVLFGHPDRFRAMVESLAGV